MVCPKCNHRLTCTNTNPRKDGSRHRKYKCPLCGREYTSTETINTGLLKVADVLAEGKASEKATEKPSLKKMVSEKPLRKPLPEPKWADDFEDDDEQEDDRLSFDDEDLDVWDDTIDLEDLTE